MRKKAISHLIPSCILMLFVAMILACSSSKELTGVGALVGGSKGGSNTGDDTGADGAMLTDTIATPFNDYALN